MKTRFSSAHESNLDSPIIGVNIAIFKEDKLLLTKREDFEVWCMPGGGVEPGETVAHAAVREAAEETGLAVRLTRLVGVYSRPGIGSYVGHIFLFAGEPVAGKLKVQPGETIDLKYFGATDLPTSLLQGQRRRILDAWSGVGGSIARRQGTIWLFEPDISYRQLCEIRDQSGLKPALFYDRFLAQSDSIGDLQEVPSLGKMIHPDNLLTDKDKNPLVNRPQSASEILASLPDNKTNTSHAPQFAADVAILQDGKILLAKREDFRVWCIPGGKVEPGETLAAAALREQKEETGLIVRLDRFVGIYSEPERFTRGLHIALFVGRIIGGSLRLQAGEVVDLQFFSPEELPAEMLYGHRQRIHDAIQGVGGSSVWTQGMPWPFPPNYTRNDIYRLRDLSNLTRSEFYAQNFHNPLPGEEVDELAIPK